MITGMEHVGLSVGSLDKSLAFYQDLIGFKLLRILDCNADSKLGLVVGMPNCHARIAHLMMNGQMLELFEYAKPQGRIIDADRCQADNGWIHVGFTSSDTRADYSRLCEAGVEFLSEPVEFRPDVWIVYFKGPDGEIIELRQTPVEETMNDEL